MAEPLDTSPRREALAAVAARAGCMLTAVVACLASAWPQQAGRYPRLIPNAGQIGQGCFAASSAGRWIAIGEATGPEVAILDAGDFSVLRIANVPASRSCPLVASQDGRWLAVGGAPARVYDVEHWRLAATLHGVPLGFSQDGAWIASRSMAFQGGAFVDRLAMAGTATWRPADANGIPAVIAPTLTGDFTAGGDFVALLQGCSGANAPCTSKTRLLEIAAAGGTARLLHLGLAHACGLAMDARHDSFLLWNDRGKAELWRAAPLRRRWAGTLPGSAAGGGCGIGRQVVLGNDGAWVAAGGSILDLARGTVAPLPAGAAIAAAWPGHDGFLFSRTTAQAQFELFGYHAATGATSAVYREELPLRGALFLPDGSGLVTARSGGDVRIWDLTSSGAVQPIPTQSREPWPLLTAGVHAFAFPESTLMGVTLRVVSRGGDARASLRLPSGFVPLARSPDAGVALGLDLLNRGASEWMTLDRSGAHAIVPGPGFRGGLAPPMAIADRGRRFVFAPAPGASSITVVQDGRVARHMALAAPGPHGAPFPVASLVLSPNGRWLAATCACIAPAVVSYVWDLNAAGEQAAYAIHATPLAFSPRSRWLYACAATCGLRDAATGADVADFGAPPEAVTSATFSPDGQWLVTGTPGGALQLWSVVEGRLRATLMMFSGGGWLVVTPQGLFDGSPDALRRARWRFSRALRDVAPVEIFLNQYYHPGLLPELFHGRHPRPRQRLATLDRRQPSVRIALASGDPARPQPRTVRVRLALQPAPPGRDPYSGRTFGQPSGVRDVRLFRNGTLVREWHGEQASRGLSAAVTLTAGANRITAYAFSDAGIKSRDATLRLTGGAALARRGAAYILAIGINRYAPSARLQTLRFADADAADAASTLAASLRALGTYASVTAQVVRDGAATRAGIAAALHAVARRIQPEDTFILYYAGHGAARGGHFYLLPFDLDRAAFSAGHGARSRAVSDRDLEAWLEPMPAAHLLLVLDACDSGAALGPSGQLIGPVNSRGLGELAFEKGLDLLAASQAAQAANENALLGHGLLTYAMLQEGLGRGRAAVAGRVEVRHWLAYTAREVPVLLRQVAGQRAQARSIAQPPGFALPWQLPRYYFRREPDAVPFLFAPLGAAAAPAARPRPAPGGAPTAQG